MTEFDYNYWEKERKPATDQAYKLDSSYNRNNVPRAAELANAKYWKELKRAEIQRTLASELYENPILRASALVSAEQTLKDVRIAENSFRHLEEVERNKDNEEIINSDLRATTKNIAKVSSQAQHNQIKAAGIKGIFAKDAIEAGRAVIDKLVEEVVKNVDVEINLASGENRESFISNEDKSKISVACSEVVKKYEELLKSTKTREQAEDAIKIIEDKKQQARDDFQADLRRGEEEQRLKDAEKARQAGNRNKKEQQRIEKNTENVTVTGMLM